MDLVNWCLSAIDQIFLTGRQGKGEPSCPDGTFFSGYTIDSWQQWKIVCLVTMSVEDVEDMYINGFFRIGFLLFGVGGNLAYRVIRKTWAAVQGTPKPPVMLDGICNAIYTQTEMLREQKRKLDAIFLNRIAAWQQFFDSKGERMYLRESCTLEICRKYQKSMALPSVLSV
ncbi:hypothetical protein ATANTOWER_025217 [Ataeniobius toweri]|uniref:Uncharacterized protein n=1 Tax=Ataeniobius toweri TaxID=208326 RepID=A0ABU7CCG6_9TELE|nr:hypothetical protein [Ataeniobius toweri]